MKFSVTFLPWEIFVKICNSIPNRNSSLEMIINVTRKCFLYLNGSITTGNVHPRRDASAASDGATGARRLDVFRSWSTKAAAGSGNCGGDWWLHPQDLTARETAHRSDNEALQRYTTAWQRGRYTRAHWTWAYFSILDPVQLSKLSI